MQRALSLCRTLSFCAFLMLFGATLVASGCNVESLSGADLETLDGSGSDHNNLDGSGSDHNNLDGSGSDHNN